MKNSTTKCRHGIALIFFILLFIYFFMPPLSGGSLNTEATILPKALDPGKMLLLGTFIIGLAAWGRKKFVK
jgi:hypothetical protein